MASPNSMMLRLRKRKQPSRSCQVQRSNLSQQPQQTPPPPRRSPRFDDATARRSDASSTSRRDDASSCGTVNNNDSAPPPLAPRGDGTSYNLRSNVTIAAAATASNRSHSNNFGGWRYKSKNHCNNSTNGTVGLAHYHRKNAQSNGDSELEPRAIAMVAANESGEEGEEGDTNEDSAEEEQQHTDYFDGTDFRTNSTSYIEEEYLKKLENDVQATKDLIDKTAGPVISHRIGAREDNVIKCSIIGWLLENRHIKGLGSASSSTKDPKHYRFSLGIHGQHQIILDTQPASYFIAVTQYGKDTLTKLGAAIVDSDKNLGADGDRSKVYSMMWKGAPKVQYKVGDDDNQTDDAALILGEHCDQDTADDKEHYTPRNVNTFGSEFYLDQTLYIMWVDNDGKEHEHKICTVSQRMEGDTSYYLSHWAAGRGAIAQTTYKGRPAVVVIKHRVWLSDKSKTCPRGIVVCDPVFKTKEEHDEYLEKVKSGVLPRRHYSKLKKLYNELVKSNPSLADYRRNLASNIRNTIKTHEPHPRDYAVQCCNNGCGNNASVLNLEQIEGRDDELSGAELHEYLQKYHDNDALAEHRLICEGCATAISEDFLVKELCLECCLNSTLSGLARCGHCRGYKCRGYNDNGETKYSCEEGGVLLDKSNIYHLDGAICKGCSKSRKDVWSRKRGDKRREKRNAEAGCDVDELGKQQMLAIYQLYDPKFRKMYPQYARGKAQIRWESACDKATGYGALAGGDKQKLKRFYNHWRQNEVGKKYDTLEQFEDYIARGGQVGAANMGGRSVR